MDDARYHRDAQPERRRPVHGIEEFGGKPTIVYDTVCTKDRKPWLACDEVHELLREVWRDADAWSMGRYMIMPDHIHFFSTPGKLTVSYGNWVKYWKSLFSKRHGNNQHRWQSGNWDVRMRTVEQYEEKWEYVRHNPVRHEHVATRDAWPYQGEIHRIRWEE